MILPMSKKMRQDSLKHEHTKVHVQWRIINTKCSKTLKTCSSDKITRTKAEREHTKLQEYSCFDIFESDTRHVNDKKMRNHLLCQRKTQRTLIN